MKNLGGYLFLADLMSEVFKALLEHRTVIEFEYRSGDDVPALQLEVRVTKVNDLKYPATRRPSTRKQFTDRLAQLNARRFATTKGRK